MLTCTWGRGGGGGAQSQHTKYWAPRMQKRHQQEHRPQRPTESSDPTQHATRRTGDCPGPRRGTTTRRTVTQGGALRRVHFVGGNVGHQFSARFDAHVFPTLMSVPPHVPFSLQRRPGVGMRNLTRRRWADVTDTSQVRNPPPPPPHTHITVSSAEALASARAHLQEGTGSSPLAGESEAAGPQTHAGLPL